MPIAQGMKNLTEDIAVSYGERMSWLADAMKDTHQMMGRIRKDHKAMAEELGLFLDDSESTRISNFKGMLSAIQARQGEREQEIASLIKRFEDELSEMATELEAFLSDSEAKRIGEFKSMLSAIKSEQRAREEEIAGLLAAFQKDTSEARTHWQNLAKVMASKRAGGKVPKEAKVSKRAEEAAEKAFEEGGLKAKILDLIEGNPKGISLSQLGNKLGVHYVRLAKTIKELIDEGKVVKRDALYFRA